MNDPGDKRNVLPSITLEHTQLDCNDHYANGNAPHEASFSL